MEKEMVIYHAKTKLVLLTLGSWLFVAAGIFFYLSPEIGLTLLTEVLVFWIGVPFFTLAGLYAAKRLMIKKPAVILDSEGFVDQASAVGAGRVYWKEVESMFIFTYGGQRFLGVRLNETSGLERRISTRKAALLNLNRKLTGAEASIHIPQTALSVKLESVLDDAEKRLQHIKRNT